EGRWVGHVRDSWQKRQRTGAVQKLAHIRWLPSSAKRRGLRQSPAAFRLARSMALARYKLQTKRQRTGAVQKLAHIRGFPSSAKRLGLRQSPAPFRSTVSIAPCGADAAPAQAGVLGRWRRA